MELAMQNNTTATSNIQEACDLLTQTECQLSFIQSITLIGPANEELTLNANQLSGLYYVIENAKNNIAKAIEDISNATRPITS